MARSKLAAEALDDGDFAGAPAGARAHAGKHATSLSLRPLLTPFKGRGRLFLRLEKLPQRATLSAGKRNSDGSWSLASDELDDVTYQVPPQAAGDHVLTIRVTALEGGEATTLKVLDFPVSFRTPASPVANETGAGQHGVASQLGHMQSLVALREAEMGLLHAQLEQEQRERARDAGLIEQRLQSAFDQRFDQTAHRHQQELEAGRAALGAQIAKHRQELEAQRTALQSKIAELTARIPAQSEKDRDAEIIRQHLQKDFDERLARAALQHRQELEAERAALRAEIAELTSRLPAPGEKERDAERIRQQVQTDFEQRFAQRFAEVAARHQQELEAERAALRAEIADLTSRVPAPGEKERDAEIIRQHLQRDFDERLASASLQHRQELEAERATLRAEITASIERADASERQLREEQQFREAHAAQSQQQAQQAETAQRHQEVSQQQLEDIRRASAAEAEENLRSARERWNADLTRAVQQAREDWSTEQDCFLETLRGQHERLIAGEREKVAILEAALAKASSQENAPDHNAAALQSLSDQLLAAGRALADRERELEGAQLQLAEAELAKAQIENTYAANDGQAEKLLQQERGNWKAEENSLREQLSTLQVQAEAQITSLTARCREAEARTNRASWGTAVKDKARIDALTLEVESLRTALAKQASAPAHHAKGGFQTAASLEEAKEAGRSKKALLRDFGIAVCCITPLILLYPYAKSFVHDFMSDDPPAPMAAATPKSAAPQAVAKAHMATVVRGVNMRKTASAKADVVFTLKKGAEVEILSTSGKWTEVGVKGQDGAQTRGWVFNTYLQTDAAN